MAHRSKPTKARSNNGANLGVEEKLWQAVDMLRGHMDAAECKHVVLNLIFVYHLWDAFQERCEVLKKEPHADPEDRDEHTAETIFWVTKTARWFCLQEIARQPSVGKLIDDAMVAIEKENPSLKSVLAKDYARQSLDKQRLADSENRSKHILARVYEYFLG